MKRLSSLLLLVCFAFAAPIQEVEVRGADPVLQALARIALPFGVGDEPGDLAQAKAAVLATGYFKDVKVSLEGQKLIVEVTPNPPIVKVSTNSKAFPPDAVLRYLETEQAIGVGSTFNAKKATEAADALAQIYRNQGFPFVPTITPEAKDTPQGVELNFNVNESPEVKSVQVANPTYVPKDKVEGLLQNIPENGKFSFERFRSAVQQVGEIYANAGFRGSGVDLAKTALEDGVLKVAFKELKIAEINAPDLNISSLGLKVGDPFNVDQILDGVNALSKQIGRVVNFTPEPVGEDGVRLTFQAGAQRYGTINKVVIEGNTAIPSEQILSVLRLKPGDEYNPTLAQEDFARILRLYRDAGYDLVQQPSPSFDNGTYTQRITELHIAGYRIDPPLTRTQPEVVLRELPKPGTLLSVPALRQGISNLLRTGLFSEPPTVTFQGTDQPGQITVVLSLKEARTGTFQPAIGWSSTTGWEGSFGVNDINLWGLAHQYNITIGANPNPTGQLFTFSASYTIPWLYTDFADLKEVKTSLTFGVYSSLNPNITLYDANNNNTGWQYTERRTGFRISASRPWSASLPKLLIGAGFGYEYVTDFLQSRTDVQIGQPFQDAAQALLPNSYGSLSLNLSATYSDVDRPDFPTQGFSVGVSTGYGLTFPSGSAPTQYVPVVITGKTYFRLDQAARQAIAVRLSLGTILGTAQDSQKFSLGGNSSDITTLRGYDPRFLDKGTSLVSGTVEYGYDFGLNPQGGTNLYGFVFTDFGRIWPATTQPDAFYLGAGVGVQLNLDLLGAVLPPLRIDYGFSQRNPTGKLSLRLGVSY
ncbi:BamA/OMP85 family outer membrane protein [Meiothermus granaticius]|uniref:Outer membrane protein assembly factor BamA n=1 Tax=Meiothermus granaticius NBRC 107808 TaxID=1227551 RepID=A0A399F8J3_9DEIN|nr:POTRA domain-containing protein [Meiothermus granaticius]RIH92987.1 Outer membrane protein assembly factor BamA [Meiothermus granaticius NBRC 107808]